MTLRLQIQIVLFTLLFVSSCSAPVETLQEQKSTTADTSVNVEIALTFINDYVAHCATMPGFNDTEVWIKNNTLLTERFKKSYFDLLETARKEDPELGLGFDPIVDAQDFPEKGFVIRQSDQQSGYVSMEGKDWQDFTLVAKLVNESGKTLVDGCGVINIDSDKRAKR